MLFTGIRIFSFLLLMFGFIFYSCSNPRVYLERMESTSGTASDDSGDNPVQIHYFFDRTESMRGFARMSDSEYIRTIPLIWDVSENIFRNRNETYYVYGERIGLTEKETILSRERGLRASSFYNNPNTRGNLIPLSGIRPDSINRPFSTVNDYIHGRIEPNDRCLYVIITDFYEKDRQGEFARFFREAFAKDLSGALFAVESKFDGVIYDVIDNETPFPRRGTTGEKIATFFILVIGSRGDVSQYSEKLFSDLTGRRIPFNQTVFLLEPTQKISPIPNFSASIGTVGTFSRFESTELRFSMVNLRQPIPDNRALSLFQWNDIRSVPADVEAYQMMSKIGIRYSAQLTDRAFDNNNFNYPVTLEIGYHSGERGKVRPGTITEFNYRTTSQDNFLFQGLPNPADAGNKQLFRRLNLVGETKDFRNIRPGYYKITYFVQAEAVIPDWVMDKNAEDFREYETVFQNSERLGILDLRSVYSAIIEAYNRRPNRIAWSGEMYLVKRK